MRPLALLAVLAALATLVGCASDPTKGYSTESSFPDDVRSVAIPIFENHTLFRDVEFDLTDALIKEIEARTPYKVLSSAKADTVLLGRIVRVEMNQLSRSRVTRLSEEVLLTVTIDFEWKDLRTDAPLLERTGFSGHGLFVPSTPTGEPIELGQFSAVQGLARDIVAEMRSNW